MTDLELNYLAQKIFEHLTTETELEVTEEPFDDPKYQTVLLIAIISLLVAMLGFIYVIMFLSNLKLPA